MSKAKVRAKEPDFDRVRSRPIEEEQKPWGSFHTLEEGPGYKVKRLVVLPGQRLSLQKHRRRAEHWVVVSGTATVVNGTRVLTLPRRACTVIPRQAWHRIENRGRKPVVIIEVQHGTYLGEDDIIRKQDDYGRIAPSADSAPLRGAERGRQAPRRTAGGGRR
jgi:mannose-6-phosphate isomerase